MGKLKHSWLLGAYLLALIIAVPLFLFLPDAPAREENPWESINRRRVHLDHAAFFKKQFASPQDVTKACLECHPKTAKSLMKTAHWNWVGDPVMVPGHDKPMRIGKEDTKNLP